MYVLCSNQIKHKMKDRLQQWRKYRGLIIDDLIGVLKRAKGKTNLGKEGIYSLDRGTLELKERHISNLDEAFNLTDGEKEFLRTGKMSPEMEKAAEEKVKPTSADLVYLITLKRASSAIGIQGGILRKDLLLTKLFTEITWHSCLSDPVNMEAESYYRHELLICKTRITSDDIRITNDFLQKIEPLLNNYQMTCENTQITAMLFSSG